MQPLRRVVTVIKAALAPVGLAATLLGAASRGGYAQDVTPPTVSISPYTSVFGSSALTPTVYWCDDVNLASLTRGIWLNGTNKRNSFTYVNGSQSCGQSKESTGNITIGEGSNSFTATICDGAGNCGSDFVTYTFGVWLSPHYQAVSVPASSSQSYTFSIQNTTGSSKQYDFTISCSGTVSSCLVPNSVTLGAGSSTNVTATYNSGAGGTSGWVSITARASSNANIYDWVDVSVAAVAPPAALVVSALYNNYDNYRSDLCDVGCFAARHAISTVPFITGDQPRSVTLVYDGDAVAVRPILSVDARIVSGGPALQEYWLEAKDSTGAFVTFLNGDTKLRFAAPSSATSKARLSGQFDAATLGYVTGVYPVTLIVTAKYTSGATEAQTISSKFLVINERKSLVARGWTVGGLSRVKVQGPDALIVESGGSAVFFPGCGTGCYSAPPGDFTRLRTTGSGTAQMFYRDFPDSSRAEYNYLGQLTRLITRTLDSTVFEYDGGTGLLRKVFDPYLTDGAGGHLFTYFHYGVTGMAHIVEPSPDDPVNGGRWTNITIASDSTLQSVQDPDGISTQFGYDSQRRLSSITNRRGDVTTLTYDPNSWKLATTVSPSFAVDPRIYGAGQTRQLTTTFRAWQTAAVPTSSTVSVPAPAVLSDTIRGAVTDAGGHVTAFTANRWGQSMVTTTLPGSALARVDSVFRDSLNIQVTKVRHHEGGVDDFGYTGPFLTSTQLAGQNAVTTQYGAFGQVTQISGIGIPTQTFVLGQRGRVDTAKVAGTYKTAYGYDGRQRVTSVTDPSGHATAYHYDATFGNLDSTLAPGGRGSRIVFDVVGRDSASRAATQPWRSTRYDLVNRPTVVKLDAAGALAADSTVTAYDNVGNVLQVTDPAGNLYQYQYNALGAVTQDTDPAGNVAKYFVDAEAVPTSNVNRRGDSLWTAVDAQHRPVTKTIKIGTTVVRRDSLFYDPAGLWSAAHNAVSRDTVFNDTTGWTDSVVTRLATDWSKRVHVRYTKDANARLDSVLVAFPGSIAATTRRYSWNGPANSLASVELNGSSVNFGYNPELIATTVTQPGGLYRTFSPTTIHALYKAGYSTTGADTLLWRGVILDTLGRAAQQFAYANSSVNKTQYVYRYDPRGRLVAVHDSTVFPTNTCGDDADFGVRLCAGYTALLQWKDSLAYDRLGNAAYANGSTGVGSASYDKNRITSWPGYTYASDAEGNVTQRAKVGGATTNFYWSADGLLDSVVVGARKIRYDYNAFGQLVRKRVDGASGETRHFFWDQGHLLAELDATLSSRVAEYAYYPGTDSPMAVVTGATTVTATRYVQQDLQGSVIGLTTSSGTVDNAVIVSRPWGEYVFWSNGGGPGLDTLRLRWKGLFYEGDSTQLYYVRARWYDPVTHRFLTQDPIGLEGGTNPYTFAGNDPVNAGDPDGLRVECTTTYIYYTHIELPEVNVSCTQTAGAGGSGFFFPPRPGGSGPWGTGGGNDGLALTPGGWGGGQSSPARPRSGAEKGLDVLGACIAEDLGLSAILAWAGVTANAWGAGTMAKGIRAGAPSARTSLAATVARDALYGRRFPKGFKMPSPTFASLKTVKYASPKVGKVLGRAVPGVGWAIWAYDAYRIGSCVIKESN